MKVFDCFTFCDENKILEIRLNELDKFVDYFVIVEFGETHQGNFKGKKINESIIKNFLHKTKYIYVEKFNIKMSPWERENFQRNYIIQGLDNAKPEDIIIISDLDEIPKLKNINLEKIGNQIFGFKQLNMMYKFNLLRDNDWIGSRLCKFKKLKSPQWLRNLKMKKDYSHFRIDKFFSDNFSFNSKIIEDGGWHFGWIKSVDEIITKLESFAHDEFNTQKFKDSTHIKSCLKNNVNFLEPKRKLITIDISNLPEYLIKNKKNFHEFISN
jgi:beta-1,4-mannosyl-glycoprotein beta-1,4-N-acetylglucosaminyltransferase